MEKTEQNNKIQMVCEKCGLIHEVENDAGENAGDQWKLIALAGGGIITLLLLWYWVFTWGVPLVKRIKNIE